LIDPSCNTDQGVLHVCKSMSAKLKGEMKVTGRKSSLTNYSALSTDPKTCSKDLSRSIVVRTRKIANYACIG